MDLAIQPAYRRPDQPPGGSQENHRPQPRTMLWCWPSLSASSLPIECAWLAPWRPSRSSLWSHPVGAAPV